MKLAKKFIAATYLDVTEADADYEALHSLQADLGGFGPVDAVVIVRRGSGEMRIYREPNNGRSVAEGAGPTWSLSPGLAAALFPSVGVDVPWRRFVQRRMLNAVAGMVSGALGRTSLHEFGTFLDDSAAGLVVATDVAGERWVYEALGMAQSSMSRSAAAVDVDGLEREAHRLALQDRPRSAY